MEGVVPPPPLKKWQIRSALLFAAGGCQVVSAGPQLAFLGAGLAGIELRARDQRAAAIAAGRTLRILAALVARGIFHGTDLGSVCPACKIETVAAGEAAG